MSQDPFNKPEEVTALIGGGDMDLPADIDAQLAKLSLNDLGNARRLMARFGRNLLYVESQGWHHWDGARWARDGADEKVALIAQRTAEAVLMEAGDFQRDRQAAAEARDKMWPRGNRVDEQAGCDPEAIADYKKAQRLWAWANQSGDQRRLKNMEAAAQPHLMALADEMDADKRAFNTQHATLGLLTEPDDSDDLVELRAQERDDRITHKGEVVFDETAEAPEFEAFLKRVVPDDDVRAFLQRWFGYCLTGLTTEQVMVVFFGTGANGKSTLVDVVGHVMGDYQMGLPVASLMHDERARGGEASPDIARLAGARLVLASEPDVGNRLSESRVKAMTGGEQMIARHLNKGFFEFYPQFKITLSCNTRPIIRGADEGIWRRVLLVPFDVQIPLAERDPDLPDKLRAEAAGILNWMLDGYRMWVEMGLAVPEAVRGATQDYRADNDPVGEFLTACCETGNHLQIRSGELYAAYAAYSRHELETKPITGNLFGRKMTDKGLKSLKAGGVKVYQGLDVSGPFRTQMAEWEHEAQHGAGDRADE